MTPRAKDVPQRGLQERIDELERENSRLSRELENRRQTEAFSNRKEKLYRMLVANLPGSAVFMVDRDFRYLLVDGPALQAAGLCTGEMEGKTIREVFDPETADRYEELYRHAFAGENFAWESHKYGRDYMSHSAPLLDEQNRIIGALALSYDVTEQKQIESKLKESEYRFRTMADGTPIIIWVTDALGGIEFINKAYTEYFGVSLDEIKSIGWQLLIHPDDIPYTEEYLACHRQHQPFHAQARVFHQDKEWRWVESYGQPRFSEDGYFLGMVGSSFDITERVEAEKTLRESEAKFRGAFENAAIGYAMTTPAGDFVDVNAAYCNLTGYSLQELKNLQLFDLIQSDDLEQNMLLFDKLLKLEISDFVLENRYRCKDGQEVRVRESVSLVKNAEGAPQWFLALVEDMSNRK
jgi:PAS domain S-box-containing protein